MDEEEVLNYCCSKAERHHREGRKEGRKEHSIMRRRYASSSACKNIQNGPAVPVALQDEDLYIICWNKAQYSPFLAHLTVGGKRCC